jgi:hypothetical protein
MGSTGDAPAVRFGYYLLQLRTEDGDAAARIGGVLEDLSTGERVEFQGLDDLKGIIEQRSDRCG